MSINKMNTVLVTAYAKAPQGSAMYEVYKHAGIVLEIDPSNHHIINAEFTFITNLAQDFFKRLIIGYDLTNGVEELVHHIETHYFAPSTGSVIVSLKAAYKRYMEKINKIDEK
jgi:gamma-glutamyl phosphate reductase